MKNEEKNETFEIESFNNYEQIQELKNTLKMIRKQKTRKILSMIAMIFIIAIFGSSLQKHGENTFLVSLASTFISIFTLCAIYVIVRFIKFIKNEKKKNG